MKWIPNALTVARCVFALLVFWAFFKAWGIGTELSAANTGDPAGLAGLQQLWFQFALLGFLAGALTDFLDGYLARKLNAQSRFGVWLDPIADKLLIGLALLGLAMIFKTSWSSTSFNCSAVIWPASCLARASFRGAVRKIEPT